MVVLRRMSILPIVESPLLGVVELALGMRAKAGNPPLLSGLAPVCAVEVLECIGRPPCEDESFLLPPCALSGFAGGPW